MRKIFPLMEDERSLASKEELANVEGKASVLAALDYYINIHSNISSLHLPEKYIMRW